MRVSAQSQLSGIPFVALTLSQLRAPIYTPTKQNREKNASSIGAGAPALGAGALGLGAGAPALGAGAPGLRCGRTRPQVRAHLSFLPSVSSVLRKTVITFSFLIGIGHMTYRWKPLGTRYQLLFESPQNHL